MARRRDDDDLEEERPTRRRRDEDDEYDRPNRSLRRRDADEEDRPRRPSFRCPYCKSDEVPVRKSQVSQAGWIVFILMLLFLCLPLCWIGLLIKEEYRVCADCGSKLGG